MLKQPRQDIVFRIIKQGVSIELALEIVVVAVVVVVEKMRQFLRKMFLKKTNGKYLTSRQDTIQAPLCSYLR